MCKYDGNSWNASHVLARATGGNESAHNLRPLAPQVNGVMGHEHMYTYVLREYGVEAVTVLRLLPPELHDLQALEET
jgi:hypothetical protein